MPLRTLILFLLLPLVPTPAEAGNNVKIVKKAGAYQLLVNGKETVINGIGCGLASGTSNENYLAMAKETGANTVRTWGIDQGTQAYLDEAHRQGLFVNAGLWLNPVSDDCTFSYITDKEYQTNARHQILDYVKKFKDHPAVILWNLGNEVFHFTKDEDERIGFAKFLNKLIKDIKKIDPRHPVVYASAGTSGLDYIIKHVPSLDIFGMNLYGAYAASLYQCRKRKLNKPVLITEFGPVLPFETYQDANGMPVEPNDHVKAMMYRNALTEIRIKSYRDMLIGVFAFHLGETTQDSLTWWNVNFRDLRLAPFGQLARTFKPESEAMVFPRIRSFKVSKISELEPGEWISVSMEANYPDPLKLQYEYFCSTSHLGVLQYFVNTRIPVNVRGSGSRVEVQAPTNTGTFRLYGLVQDDSGNAAIQNVSLSIE